MSFDRLAPFYTWMEIVLAGPRLQRCRLAWIDALARCDDILIAGVGHGHFLAAHVQQFPDARITCVDASSGMLHHARRRAERAGARMENLAFVHATLPDWNPPPDRFDAVVTHFFLDCFAPDELHTVVGALAAGAKKNAAWLLSDFNVPPAGFARQRARAVHALMYAFFRRLTKISARALTPPDPFLQAEGFQLTGRASASWGLLHADCWKRSPALA
jgi:ubiquinone/menaquinone biosynthesis C-methylase UbiE